MPKPSAAPSESRQKFEKQVEELCATLEELRPGTGAGIQVLLTMAYEQAERDTREQLGQRWIPVEEKLPENPGQYLVWVYGIGGDGEMVRQTIEARFDQKNWFMQGGWLSHEVQGWQNLPDPPVAERVRGKGAL